MTLPTLNVTAIGHRASGKTVYFKTACDVLEAGRRGFTMRCEDRGSAQDLRTEYRCMQLQHRFPPGTLSRSDYDFRLAFDGTDIMRIRWIDYRGGLLFDDPANNQDVAALFEHINRSDVLLLFVDGHALGEGILDDEQVWSLNDIVSRYFSVNSRKDVSIAIVLTKIDGLGIDPRQSDTCSRLLSRTHRTFCRLLDRDVKSAQATRLATIIPVSSTGPVCEWRFEDPLGPNDGFFTLKSETFCPQNVELPIFWAIQYGLSGIRSELVAHLERYQQRESEIRQRANSARTKANSFGGWLHDTWQSLWSNPTHSDVAAQLERQRQQLDQEGQDIGQHIQDINDAFDEVNRDLLRYPQFSRHGNTFALAK